MDVLVIEFTDGSFYEVRSLITEDEISGKNVPTNYIEVYKA